MDKNESFNCVSILTHTHQSSCNTSCVNNNSKWSQILCKQKAAVTVSPPTAAIFTSGYLEQIQCEFYWMNLKFKSVKYWDCSSCSSNLSRCRKNELIMRIFRKKTITISPVWDIHWGEEIKQLWYNSHFKTATFHLEKKCNFLY